MRSIRWLALAACSLLVACGDAAPVVVDITDDPDASGEQATTPGPVDAIVDAAPTAVLAIISDAIEAASGDSGFAPAVAGQELAVGDQVRTNATGFAEVNYHDGSWQRLDRDATLTIVELVDTAEAEIVRSAIDIGRSWNVVRELTGPEDAYEVETPVATASVRGTVFVTDCPTVTECTFAVLEGSILIAPRDGDPFVLTAPAQVTVFAGAGGQPGAPIGLTEQDLADDEWIVRNRELDLRRTDGEVSADDPEPADPGEAIDLASLNVCEWLTDAELAQAFGLDDGQAITDGEDFGCMWGAGEGLMSGDFAMLLQVDVFDDDGSGFVDVVDDPECTFELFTEGPTDGAITICAPDEPGFVQVSTVRAGYLVTLLYRGYADGIVHPDADVWQEMAVSFVARLEGATGSIGAGGA